MIYGYNHSTVVLKDKKASQVAVKGKDTATMLYTFKNGQTTINTDTYTAGDYYIQYFDGDAIFRTDVLRIDENLKYVSNSYNPTPQNKIILDAINAYLAGVATHQQKRVKVGDKQIEYSSFDQLMKWKNYYEIEVRKQQGKAGNLRFEKLYYRGI